MKATDYTAADYVQHKAKMAARSREKSATGRDIGTIPEVQNPERRAAAEASLQVFLETYFPETFTLAWSSDHVEVIAAIEDAIIRGGISAYAMERGSGKTAITERAIIWSSLKGLHDFALLIGASGGAADELIKSIKDELSSNELLAADFPEVCFPIWELEDNPQLCRCQTLNGQRTKIGWKKHQVVFPIVPGSKAAGITIKVASITGRIRGMKFLRFDGRTVRPSLVLLDDLQTDQSAWSPVSCEQRLKTVNGTILKLAGPGVTITVFVPCTVIRKGDAADTLLDREKCPHFKGRRCKKLYSFPTRMDLWKQYAAIRAESLRCDGRGEEATAFYTANRDAMDDGANVAWPQRFDPADLSAVQTCMNLYFEDKYSFMAECQNEPIDELAVEGRLTPAEVINRFSGRDRFVIPGWASKVTAFIDVQQSLLYGMVCAWNPENFTGSVIYYGTWPDQPGRNYFTLSDAQHTIQLALPGMGLEAQLREALKRYQTQLAAKDWRREDGMSLKIDRLFIDSGYQMDEVFEACRVSPFGGAAMPSRGQPLGVKQKPMIESKANPGDRKGYHWFIGPQRSGNRVIRWCRIDTYFWKTFMLGRLRQPIGDPGALTLHGHSRADADHDMLADHLTSERGDVVSANGRQITEWTTPPGAENHWWDCLIGCAVGASVEGAILVGQTASSTSKRPKMSMSEQQRLAMSRRA